MKKIFTLLVLALAMILCLGLSIISDRADGGATRPNTFNSKFDTSEANAVLTLPAKRELPKVTSLSYSKTVKNNETTKTTPKATFGQSSFQAGYTYSHVLSDRAIFGKTTVKLDIPVSIYTNGSFRQINTVGNNTLFLEKSVAETSIEGYAVSVYSINGYPTTSLKYSFSGTLVTTVKNEASQSIAAELLRSGFTFSHADSQNSYYRRWFNQNGTISIY